MFHPSEYPHIWYLPSKHTHSDFSKPLYPITKQMLQQSNVHLFKQYSMVDLLLPNIIIPEVNII